MGAEFSHFLQPEGRGQIPVGDRLHLTPSIGFDLWQPYGFLRGKSQLWLTHYALTNNIDNQLTRVVPVSSLDAGLLFEKPISLFDRAWVHTLEPRVKYLLVPKVDQSRYPVFDSMQRNFDYLQLFADNRFTGIDRIGDANQLTTGLFSRLLHEDGREFLELGLGQISYFQSRDVQLPGYSSEKGDFSDIIATASLALDQRWRASLTQQLDRDTKRLMQEDASVQYIGQQDNRFVVRHRLRYKGAPTEDEQYMVGGKLRHNGLWSSLHYVNYNNTVKQLRGAINAVQYDSCCWAGQLIWEHNIYINEVQDDIIRLAFIFKGLTTFGSTASEKVDSRLYFE
jgi:LPS-assembly protein